MKTRFLTTDKKPRPLSDGAFDYLGKHYDLSLFEETYYPFQPFWHMHLHEGDRMVLARVIHVGDETKVIAGHADLTA